MAKVNHNKEVKTILDMLHSDKPMITVDELRERLIADGSYRPRHRLHTDFPNSKGIRYFSICGTLYNTGRSRSVASVNNALHVGETWRIGQND